MRYGIYDKQDNLWLGENEAKDGPAVFDEGEFGQWARQIATVAAQVVRIRAGWEHGRVVVKEFDEGALRKRDEVPLRSTNAKVLEKLERGTIV